MVAFLWPVTSTAIIRTRWSSWGAAMPTQWPNDSIVSTRSVGDLRDHVAVVRSQLPRLLLQRRVRIAKDLADGHRAA